MAELSVTIVPQHLYVLPDQLWVHRLPPDAPVPALPDRPWCSVTRARDGLTVVCAGRLPAGAGPVSGPWRGLYGADAHGLDLPGMLAGVLVPLAGAGIGVFAASTFDADLVLVPAGEYERARTALEAAGHTLSSD
ncbi:ACT domain-containing protein [Streptomyces sp. NPDC048349]|uniref:ACT domain-containing protein n=1 Tax=Streptomyces sp. NPDC048349 TaxID=3155486 RepID=UPI0034210A01